MRAGLVIRGAAPLPRAGAGAVILPAGAAVLSAGAAILSAGAALAFGAAGAPAPVSPLGPGIQEDPYAEARAEMVRRHIASVPPGADPIEDPAVLRAMSAVPRHEFVPPDLRDAAYLDRPLPIGGGQTISQPYIVALMTQLVEPEPEDAVLEVGTGSGYQAAVLAEIVDSVYTIEIDGELARTAAARLARLGYGNVAVRHGDGYRGWPERAPFDAIVVTAAPDHVPGPLVEQLAPGGKMVIPVGPAFRVQRLLLLEKSAEGEVTRRAVTPVQFVPFRRDDAERPPPDR